jgi:two-component sensor histidine kinase
MPARLARKARKWVMGTPAIMFFIMMLALLPFAAAALLSNWLTVSEKPSSDETTRIVALLMPILLWLSAAFLAWLVVRWILIEPLVALRREVANYAPGEVMHIPFMSKAASKEIRELGEAFHTLSTDVAHHETDMMSALLRQKELTREIHHRVKNNLQIISSLISLHWRAASDENAAAAYLSIQRRVDALSVVQRNHYADLEEQKGVRARAILNEIAASLKTSAQIQSDRILDMTVACEDLSLHLDVAAPIAFMTAELADIVISEGSKEPFNLSLTGLPNDPAHARYVLESPLFSADAMQSSPSAELCERVLSGLARQLRTPLDHDAERGSYAITIAVIE